MVCTSQGWRTEESPPKSFYRALSKESATVLTNHGNCFNWHASLGFYQTKFRIPQA